MPHHKLDEQNTKVPLVCHLTVSGSAEAPPPALNPGSKVLKASAYQRYTYETLTRTCVSFKDQLPPAYALKHLDGVAMECALASAAKRVFPAYKGASAKPKKSA